MGGAVFTSLDGETNFASLPERVEVALRGALGVGADRLGAPRKSDRLPTAEEPTFARQVIRVSTIDAGRQSRSRARAPVRAHRRQPVAHRLRSLRQHPAVQSAAPAGGIRARRRQPRPTTRRRPSRMPKSPSSCATSRPMLPKLQDRAASRRTTKSWRACAKPPTGASKAAKHVPVAPNITGIKLAYAGEATPPILMPASKRASCPRTSRCCRRPPIETTGGNPLNERDRSWSRRATRVASDPARSRRHARRDRRDHQGRSARAAATAASRKARSCAC